MYVGVDNSILVFNLENGLKTEAMVLIPLVEKSPTVIVLDSSNTTLYVGTNKGSVLVYDNTQIIDSLSVGSLVPEPLTTLEPHKSIKGLAVSEDGMKLYSGGVSEIIVWDRKANVFTQNHVIPMEHGKLESLTLSNKVYGRDTLYAGLNNGDIEEIVLL